MLDVNYIIPAPFSPLLDPNIQKVVEESGRTAGKSTTNETVAISKMMAHRDNNIWYCRAEKGDVRPSIFNSFLATANDMGLDRHFKFKLNPMEITCTLSGAKCYFSGINGKTVDDLNATKGFVPQNRKLAMFIMDEANEAKSLQHIRAAETTANKFLMPGSKIIYAYNPPPNLAHWAHSYFGREIENGATRIYSTYRDIWGLLNQATKDLILEMKRDNPRQYQYWYLGQKISLQGLVLYTFKRERNVVELNTMKRKAANGYQPLFIIYGVDSGVVNDATAVSAWGVFPDGNLIKLYTFYLDPKVIGEPIPNTTQVTEIHTWYQRFYNEMASYGIVLPGPYNECWVFDSAVVTQDLMLEFGNRTGFNCKAVENKSIERDIKRLQNGYFRGVFQILDIPANAPSFREIGTFVYDEKNEIPDGQSDHTIDADKYATAHYYYAYLNNFA
ncbi:MAG: phage terminase large subunit [Clostridia bacterium]|nr:phage terminase large subunit [Clostridia bacterium]